MHGDREEERRQVKRSRGIHPSSLPLTFFSYFGVTKCVAVYGLPIDRRYRNCGIVWNPGSAEPPFC